jgi:hypothetical protein
MAKGTRGRVGRPTSSRDGARRTARVDCLLSPTEKEALTRNARACHRSVTDLIVDTAVHGVDPADLALAGDLGPVLTELRRQGTNLNQIAAAANRLAVMTDAGETGADVSAAADALRGLVSSAGPAVSESMAMVRRLVSSTYPPGRDADEGGD